MNVNTCQFTLGSTRIRSMIGGNLSNRRNPTPNSESLATFSRAKARIRTRAVVRDREQSVAARKSTRPSEQA